LLSEHRQLEDLPAVLLLVQSFTHPNFGLWNVPSWSISVELWLYLLAALAWRYLGRGAKWVALAIALAALACFFDFGPLVVHWNWWLRGLGGFGLGMVAWEVHRRRPALSRAGQPAATVLEAVVVALLAVTLTNPYGPALFTPVCALLVVVFAQERGLVSRLLHAAPFVFLGTISYSLYMTHNVLIGRLYDVLVRLGPVLDRPLILGHADEFDRLAGPAWQADLLALGMLAALILPAWIAWRLVENPAREWSRRRAERWGVAEEEKVAPTI
jgi:peptidoglycan/LPS O-acetylase OafA/YrhL